MSTLLAGASGLVGHALLHEWGARPEQLHLLLRRPWPAAQALPEAARVHLVDFAALPPLPAATRAICCLGTTIATAGSQAAFRAVDFGAVLAFARAAQAAGATRLALVSALGADPRSASFYSRTKGEAEQALRALGLRTLVIARPSLLLGDRAALGQRPRPAEALAARLARPLAGLIPAAWRPIEAATVARALLAALDDTGAGVRVLDSSTLQGLGRR